MNEIERRLSEIMGGSILDVATGQGQFVDALIEALAGFERITGIDTSESHLEAARRRFSDPKIEFRQMDCHQMSFPNEYFDTVTISNSLHHLKDPRQALDEMFRVCKQEGLVMISEMIRDQANPTQQTHVELHHWWSAVDTLNGITHNETYTRAELEELVGQIAFGETDIYEDTVPDDDPREPERLKQLHGIIDDYMVRIPDDRQFAELRERGEQLRKRLDEIGVTWATTVVVMAKK